MKTRAAAVLALASCIGMAAMSTTAYAGMRGCGRASDFVVRANAKTSCGFARKIAFAYVRGASSPRVYSNATKRFYRVTCKRFQEAHVFVSCRAGNGAWVLLL